MNIFMETQKFFNALRVCEKMHWGLAYILQRKYCSRPEIVCISGIPKKSSKAYLTIVVKIML